MMYAEDEIKHEWEFLRNNEVLDNGYFHDNFIEFIELTNWEAHEYMQIFIGKKLLESSNYIADFEDPNSNMCCGELHKSAIRPEMSLIIAEIRKNIDGYCLRRI